MANINFDEGYKKFTLNNDPNRVIKFNPGDVEMMNRIIDCQKSIDEEVKTLDDIVLDNEGNLIKADNITADEFEKTAQKVKDFGQFIKDKIDYVFNDKISEVVFQNQSPLSLVEGRPLFYGFLESVIPELEREIKAEQQKSRQKINKYTSQVKKSNNTGKKK